VRLTASPWMRRGEMVRLARSNVVEVPPGSRGVRIELRPGATVTARAVDAHSGEPVLANYQLIHPDLRIPRKTQGVARPLFEVDRLPEGRASIAAFTRDGRAGIVDSVEIESGAELEVEIPVVAAGFFELDPEGAEGSVRADLIQGDHLVRSLMALARSPGAAARLRSPVPPGNYTVRVQRSDAQRSPVIEESQVTILEGRHTVVGLR
ncbi:MAG: hypothetical protein AAF726_21745, partial [Planctomycetota bacterium]